MATTALNGFGVFGDEVYTSTDLNRRSGEVLNHARERPVTISRNNEQFALLRRDQAAKLIRTANGIGAVVEVLSALQAAMTGGEPPVQLKWIKVFDKDDQQKFCSELLSITREAALNHCDWALVDALIHEWRESGLVAQNGVLDNAMFNTEVDETPLPHPDEIVESTERAVEEECPKV